MKGIWARTQARLGKKLGPLPLGVWLAIVGVAGVWWWRRRAANAAATTPAASTAAVDSGLAASDGYGSGGGGAGAGGATAQPVDPTAPVSYDPSQPPTNAPSDPNPPPPLYYDPTTGRTDSPVPIPIDRIVPRHVPTPPAPTPPPAPLTPLQTATAAFDISANAGGGVSGAGPVIALPGGGTIQYAPNFKPKAATTDYGAPAPKRAPVTPLAEPAGSKPRSPAGAVVGRNVGASKPVLTADS